MAHVKEQIRKSFVTRLTGLTTTGANVESNRVHPFLAEDATLPGLVIYTSEEEILEPDEGIEIGTQHRILQVIVEGYVDGLKPTLEDILDDITKEVEVAVFTDPFFSNLAMACDLIAVNTDIIPGAAKPVGMVENIFRVQYMTREGAPETSL